MTGTSAFSLFKTYVHLTEGPLAIPLEAYSEFWRQLADSPSIQDGRRLSLVHVAEDWDAWEMHPEGDEIALLRWGEWTSFWERTAMSVALHSRPPCVHCSSGCVAHDESPPTQQRPAHHPGPRDVAQASASGQPRTPLAP